MKRWIALCLVLCLALPLAGCGDWDEMEADPLRELTDYYQPENEAASPTPVTDFTLPWHPEETLDPLTCADGWPQTVGALLYEGLYALDSTFTPYPVLAQSARYDAAEYTYTITVRRGVTFTDGAPLTANDVAQSLRRARLCDRYASRLQQVKSVESRDNDVIITLQRDNRQFLALLDIPIARTDVAGAVHPLGTGPYYLAQDEGNWLLCANDNWWQQKTVPLRRISLMSCKSDEAMLYAFSARDVHLLRYELTGVDDTIPDLRSDYTDAPAPVLQYLGFHLGHELLQDDAVRRAISLAIDRQRITGTYLLGHGEAAQFPVHPQSPLYPADLARNPTRSEVDATMTDLGLMDGEERWTLDLLVYSENSFSVAICQAIADTLARYDLDVTVRALPWEDYLSALAAGEFDLYFGQCRMTADWDMTSLVGMVGNLNLGGYWDETTDALIARSLSATDEARPDALYQLCQHLQETCPIAPLCFKSVTVLTTSGLVENVSPTAANPFYGMENWTLHMAE